MILKIKALSIALLFILSNPLLAVENINTQCGLVMTPVMSAGDKSHIDVRDRPAVVAFDYDDRGSQYPASTLIELAKVNEVGTTWGSAYDANARKYYVAAFLRRHADISPDGLGAIYEIDVSNTSNAATIGTPTLWMDLNTSAHLGAGATLFPSETASNRNLTGPRNPSHDVWSFTRVGKQGLGGMDLSDDGSTLYVMDLTNRQVLVIDVTSKTVTARHTVSDPGCTGGTDDIRPFGVDVLNNDLYIGVTCSGETNQSDDFVNTYVMKLDGNNFTNVVNDVLKDSDLSWLIKPWLDDPYMDGGSCNNTSGENMVSKATPVITNMELDQAGNMLIGVADVNGWRFGWENYYPDTSCSDTDSWTSFGYLIRATPTPTGWDREATPTDKNTAFFGWGINNADGNNRSFTGGLSVTACSGQDVAIVNIQDPISTVEGGTRFIRATDGQQEAASSTGDVDSATRQASGRLLIKTSVDGWGKASGLGDVEYMHAPTLPAGCKLISNTAGIISHDQPENYKANNAGSVSVQVCDAAEIDLALDKEVNPTQGVPGDTVIYTLTVRNEGNNIANDIVVSDVLPNGVSYVSAQTTGAGSYSESNGTITWEISSLAANSSEVLTITTTVD